MVMYLTFIRPWNFLIITWVLLFRVVTLQASKEYIHFNADNTSQTFLFFCWLGKINSGLVSISQYLWLACIFIWEKAVSKASMHRKDYAFYFLPLFWMKYSSNFNRKDDKHGLLFDSLAIKSKWRSLCRMHWRATNCIYHYVVIN